MFMDIQNHQYTLNVALISEIEWGDNEATVTMVTGKEYTIEGDDYDRLLLELLEVKS